MSDRSKAPDARRVALVTGGASGIGLACARALADAGHGVAIVDVDEARGPERAAELGATFVQADLASREGCRIVHMGSAHSLTASPYKGGRCS